LEEGEDEEDVEGGEEDSSVEREFGEEAAAW